MRHQALLRAQGKLLRHHHEKTLIRRALRHISNLSVHIFRFSVAGIAVDKGKRHRFPQKEVRFVTLLSLIG